MYVTARCSIVGAGKMPSFALACLRHLCFQGAFTHDGSDASFERSLVSVIGSTCVCGGEGRSAKIRSTDAKNVIFIFFHTKAVHTSIYSA